MPETAGTAGSPADSALAACGLPGAWQGRPAWRLLDLDFGTGAAFAQTWSCWQADPHAPRLLHYVAACDAPPPIDPVLHTLAASPELADQCLALREQWFGVARGTHRISLHAGRLLLTLCIGPRLEALRDMRFTADTVYAPASGWDAWSAKALARVVQAGTPLALAHSDTPEAGHLLQAGFAPAGRGGAGFLSLAFQPPWKVARSRDRWRSMASPPDTCVVLGAGLAGAAVAASMARRGWSVRVFDALPGPAAAASGLPVGLLVGQHSQDDNPRSQFSRAGVRLTLQACRERLQAGADWMPCGVLRLDPDQASADGAELPPVEWNRPYRWPAEPPPWSAGARRAGARWNAHAGWVKPAALVHALLQDSGASFAGHTRVHALRPSERGWDLLDEAGTCMARAAHVVLCNALDAARLLHATVAGGATGVLALEALQGVAGQLSWGLHTGTDCTAFPPHPVHGAGSFVAGVPLGQESAWFAGATYEAPQEQTPDDAMQHNLERLHSLLPAARARIAILAQHQPVQAWRGQRCVTPDRMPVCGALLFGAQPSLWISAAMGSRGLNHAILCAELIAAQANGEPLPVAPRLARLVRPDRPRLSDHL